MNEVLMEMVLLAGRGVVGGVPDGEFKLSGA